MTRKEQILKFADLDGNRAASFCKKNSKIYQGKEGGLIKNTNHATFDGILWERGRLMPIITALAERVEMLEAALSHTKEAIQIQVDMMPKESFVHAKGIHQLTLEKIIETARQALTTPTALDALLKGNM